MKDLSTTIIVFLDIDGVILPFGHLLFPDPQLEALSSILEAFADNPPEIVLSSTWRVQEKFRRDILNQFHNYAYQHGGPLTEIEFYDVTDISMHSERHYEIDAWLQAQTKQPLAWIALDDEDLLLGGTQTDFHAHAVHTDSHEGLTAQMARRAIDLLQKQLPINDKRRL